MSIIYPLIQNCGPRFEMSDANFAELQRTGEIPLSGELRSRLSDLAQFWAAELAKLQSPRPKQFRTRLKLIESTLAEAYDALDLNRAGTSMWERHLFNWARNAEVEGATNFFDDTDELLIRMRLMIDLMARLQLALPRDGGGPRSYNDKRLFIALANIFESAGGAAVAYWSEHQDPSGMADTAFRRFVQAFYKMLPIQSKRKPAGVDEVLRDAIASRRTGAVKG